MAQIIAWPGTQPEIADMADEAAELEIAADRALEEVATAMARHREARRAADRVLSALLLEVAAERPRCTCGRRHDGR